MSVSYEGIGQWAATFACGGVREGQVVKVSANGTVSGCEEGDRFCGMALAVWINLAADGNGGVAVVSAGGRSCLAVDVDSAARTVTFVL